MEQAEQELTIYTTGEVARLLGYSGRRIRILCEKGRFPNAFRTHAAGHWRIPKTDIDALRASVRPVIRRGRVAS